MKKKYNKLTKKTEPILTNGKCMEFVLTMKMKFRFVLIVTKNTVPTFVKDVQNMTEKMHTKTVPEVKEISKEEFRKIIMKAHKKVMNDPKVKEETEELVRKYGTLTQEELHREFTI